MPVNIVNFISILNRYRRRSLQQERERQRQEKEQLAHEQYMEKFNQEAARRRQAEGAISQMEREERELISRLRKTQEMQEKVSKKISIDRELSY